MNIPISITSLVNNLDGLTATATLDGLPEGAITFFTGRTPVLAEANPALFTGSNPYMIHFSHPDLWYVWCADAGAPTAEPEAVWVGTSNNQDMNECGEWLRDLLRANKKGLEAAIRPIYPEATIKQIVYGINTMVFEFPAVVISAPTLENPWLFLPFGSENDFSLQIALIVQRMDEQSELPLMTRLARACQRILNQPAYLEVTLPGGTPLVNARADVANVMEREVEGRFLSIGVLRWSAYALAQDTGNR